ncbi:MAG: hypothetical protein Q9M75_03650 [Ghiorsea sp.]|nr:hypothetical protein [Ghiorsea sp.]MDQ6981303.1 hypothetical protein [Ghiorsea sp.]MDQ7057888.1 hypothetical protein [Ghiorsea sp.]
MRYLTLLLCAMLVTSCANKQQERAVIAGAILGGMIGAATAQPASTGYASPSAPHHAVEEDDYKEERRHDLEEEHDDEHEKKKKRKKKHDDDEHDDD